MAAVVGGFPVDFGLLDNRIYARRCVGKFPCRGWCNWNSCFTVFSILIVVSDSVFVLLCWFLLVFCIFPHEGLLCVSITLKGVSSDLDLIWLISRS